MIVWFLYDVEVEGAVEGVGADVGVEEGVGVGVGVGVRVVRFQDSPDLGPEFADVEGGGGGGAGGGWNENDPRKLTSVSSLIPKTSQPKQVKSVSS